MTSLSLLAIISYFIALVGISRGLLHGQRLARGPRAVVLAIIALSLIFHGVVLFRSLVAPTGVNLGFFNAGSLISWLMVLLLWVAAIRKPVLNLGLILLPLAAIALSLEQTLPSQHVISTGPWQLQAHIVISILAYALLGIAMIQALLLAVQDYHLHNRQPGGFIRALPPLQTMEKLLFQLITIGFVLLTIGLLIGLLFLDDIFGRHLVHKTVLSIIAWCLFAVLLWGRYQFGWRGRRAIRWTLGGFVTLMLAYFGSKMVLELILDRAA